MKPSATSCVCVDMQACPVRLVSDSHREDVHRCGGSVGIAQTARTDFPFILMPAG